MKHITLSLAIILFATACGNKKYCWKCTSQGFNPSLSGTSNGIICDKTKDEINEFIAKQSVQTECNKQ